ncbi:hypothetical protein CSO01_21660 [Cellulomonas soli]|uniref:Uncharacterized protein n=1 Tax=Cellulomonas soli TaxID=931535 RepID=A0A512PE21_9CELL|nr:hypothetical protein CSO01_21660 [Cellulomonas soli]
MQSCPLFALRQGHLDRLRHARRLRDGGRAAGGAVHLPLSPDGVVPRQDVATSCPLPARRLVATVLLGPQVDLR